MRNRKNGKIREMCAKNRKKSVYDRHIEPELLRAEPRADILRDADDRCGQAAADLAGLGQRLAVGQADDRPGEESIPRAGGVDDIDLLGGHHAALAVGAGVDGALLAHRYDHAGNVGAAHVGGQRGAHLVRRQVAVIVGEHQPGLLLVADKAVDLLREAAALHGNAHVGDRGVDRFCGTFWRSAKSA